MKKLLQRLIAPVATFLALGSAAQARTPQVAKPALWAVSDPDTTIYLFGTIHLLPEHLQWRTAKLDDAISRSQELVVETIVDEKNPTKLMSALASLGLAKGLPPILDRVPPAKRPALEAAIKKSGVPVQALNGMKSWMAAFLLLSNQFKALNLSGGVEGVLRSDFAAQSKPIDELETNVEQLSFFDRLPESAQRVLLEGAIEDNDSMKNEFGGMLKAWSRGDVAGIAKTFDRDLSTSPELRDALLRQRNATWSKWIEQRMAQPGAVLIAVGAGHLAGKYSVLELLKKDGYTVRRVQ
ncbi:MAG: TraB/GumN family protein [Sphingomonas sp.]